MKWLFGSLLNKKKVVLLLLLSTALMLTGCSEKSSMMSTVSISRIAEDNIVVDKGPQLDFVRFQDLKLEENFEFNKLEFNKIINERSAKGWELEKIISDISYEGVKSQYYEVNYLEFVFNNNRNYENAKNGNPIKKFECLVVDSESSSNPAPSDFHKAVEINIHKGYKFAGLILINNSSRYIAIFQKEIDN